MLQNCRIWWYRLRDGNINSTSLESRSWLWKIIDYRLEDEICNGGFNVWTSLFDKFSDCPKPCKITTYKDSKLDLKEPLFLKTGQSLAKFQLVANKIRSIEKEVLVYDLNDVIGAVGGSMGLFLGFSFFDVISKSLDNLFMLTTIYLPEL